VKRVVVFFVVCSFFFFTCFVVDAFYMHYIYGFRFKVVYKVIFIFELFVKWKHYYLFGYN
jgi:hypothetical protein